MKDWTLKSQSGACSSPQTLLRISIDFCTGFFHPYLQDFSNQFFKGLDVQTFKIGGKLSPKILIVKPKARLSWQYHHRRAEIWRVFKGECGIIRSDTDMENEMKIDESAGVLHSGKPIVDQVEPHRMGGDTGLKE